MRFRNSFLGLWDLFLCIVLLCLFILADFIQNRLMTSRLRRDFNTKLTGRSKYYHAKNHARNTVRRKLKKRRR